MYENYQDKIDEINNLCNKLYETMLNKKINVNILEDEEEEECLIGEDTSVGMSLDQLRN